MNPDTKAIEARLRRRAQSLGLRLKKPRATTPGDPMANMYWLMAGKRLAAGCTTDGLTLEVIGALLEAPAKGGASCTES